MENNKAIKKYFPIFVLPTLLAFILFFFIPFVMGFVLSFTKFKVITDAHFIGFKNYIRAFTLNNEFIHALGFTSLFTVVSVITVNVFAFILALLLTHGLKGTNFFRSVFFMPNLIGGIVLGYIWNLLINGVLLRYFGEDISFNAKYGFWGLVILTNWQLIGYMMVIYIAGLQKAADEGVPVMGYTAWSVMDNYEWAEGYLRRFGLIYVDYKTQERIPKDSFWWYKDVIRKNGVDM